MYFYQAGATSGWYQFIYQRVPAAQGSTYEASIYANPHRCSVGLILRFVDASLSILADAGGGPDTIDAGIGIIGDAFDTSTHPRLWRSGVAPAGTTYIEFFALKYSTTPGQADSYGFFSKAMLCVAPSGVTRETATPWVDDSVTTIDGQLQKTYSQFVASTNVYVPLSQTRTLSSFVFTPEVSGSMLVDVSVGRIYHSGPSYAQVVGVLTVTQGASFTYQDCGRTQWNSAETEWSSSPKALLLVNVVAGVAVTLAFDIYGGGADVTVYGEQIRFSATVTRKTT
jgi:hypothetical protein